MRPSLLLLAFVALVGCAEPAPRLSAYEQGLLQARLEKDTRLRARTGSLLAPEARARFTGLRYFSVDSAYRFVLPLEPAPPETIRAALRKGGTDRYVRLGTVSFALEGAPERLAVYRPADGRDVLWLPFRDATTGRETYGGGRYLNPPRLPDGRLVVDFNEAYNPDCEYNPALFNCALPPAENRLNAPVPAGEKKALLYE